MEVANYLRVGGTPDSPLYAGQSPSGEIFVAVVAEGDRYKHASWEPASQEEIEVYLRLRAEQDRYEARCPDTGDLAIHCECGWH
jgi:hypothetical protein